jgi:hypothetical protein
LEESAPKGNGNGYAPESEPRGSTTSRIYGSWQHHLIPHGRHFLFFIFFTQVEKRQGIILFIYLFIIWAQEGLSLAQEGLQNGRHFESQLMSLAMSMATLSFVSLVGHRHSMKTDEPC